MATETSETYFQLDAPPAPGRLKGRWRPDVRYSEGDLADAEGEVRILGADGKTDGLPPGAEIAGYADETGKLRKPPRWWVAAPDEIEAARAESPDKFRQSMNLNRRPALRVTYREAGGAEPVPSEIREIGGAYYLAPSNSGGGVKAELTHRDSDGRCFWKPSVWENVTEEVTQYPNKYVRLQSVQPQLLDAFVLSKGVPAWYYYDLLGHPDSRRQLKGVVDLLRSVRGTVYGLKAYLNLINLEADVERLKPEEAYEFNAAIKLKLEEALKDFDSRLKRNYQEFERLRDSFAEPEFGLGVKNAAGGFTHIRGKAWSDEDREANKDFKAGDYCFLNWTGNGGGKDYRGCLLFRKKRDWENRENPIRPPEPDSDGKARDSDDWEWIYTYKVITREAGYYKELSKELRLWTANYNPDNSMYRLHLANFLGPDANADGSVTNPEAQQRITCHLRGLIEFLIPAWIRMESEVYLLDRADGGVLNHASSFGVFPPQDSVGAEPHTLTVLPCIGPMGAWISRTDAVGVREDGSEFGLTERDALVSDAEMDGRVLSGEIKGYYWRENYMDGKYPDATLKVRVPAFQKVKLTARLTGGGKRWRDLEPHAWREYEIRTWGSLESGVAAADGFQRWSLLNSYHYLPHFRVADCGSDGRWMDMEPTAWGRWANTRWADISGNNGTSRYACCNTRGD